MTFSFTMKHEASIVDCEVSSVALDDLAGKKSARPSEREAQFKALCDAIERVASDIFDKRCMAEEYLLKAYSKPIMPARCGTAKPPHSLFCRVLMKA